MSPNTWDLQEPLRLITSLTASLTGDHHLPPAERYKLHAAVLDSAEEASAAAKRLLTDVPHRRTQPAAKLSIEVTDARR